jgi:serine/threonine protein kinase
MAIALGDLRLRFDEPAEREFLDEYSRSSLDPNRAALLMGIFLYAVFGLLDPLIVPDVKRTVWTIRYAVVCPVFVIGLFLTYLPAVQRFMQALLSAYLLIAGFGIIAMVAIATPPGNYLYYAGLLLCVMFGYAFLRLRFFVATASCLALFVGYEVTALWIKPAGTVILVNNTFFLVAANVIGMAANYSIEWHIRRTFLQNRIIEQRTKELEATNLELIAVNDELARSKEDVVQSARRAELVFSALSEVLPGTVLDDKYQVDEKIGSGGFGTVYRATHLHLHNSVALKVFRPSAGSDPMKNLERLRLEGISASHLRHRNVVSILDFGECAGSIGYMVMELLHGWSLKDELDVTERLTIPRCLSIVVPICDALAHAHALGIVHRDIKPSNIFIDQSEAGEVVKVVDFGVAKILNDAVTPKLKALTETGLVLGTLSYMAPERLDGRPYDGQSDMYSVGIMLYEMLCGRLPFEKSGDNFWSMGVMHLTTAPTPPHAINVQIPQPLESIVMAMLEKDPAKRPTASESAKILLECASGFDAVEAAASPQVRGVLTTTRFVSEPPLIVHEHATREAELRMPDATRSVKEIL